MGRYGGKVFVVRKPKKKAEPSAPDFLDAINATAARAIREWMLAGGVNVHAPVKSMTEEQMKAIAAIAWSVYVCERAKSGVEAEPDPELEGQMDLWLGG
jgi:hypothetical protein